MSHRPLVFLSGLTVGDYLLWNWSLNGNRDVLALASGLTLPPLTVAWVWLLALSAARLLARYTRRSSGGAAGRTAAARAATARPKPTTAAAPMEGAAGPSARSAGRSSNRLAA